MKVTIDDVAKEAGVSTATVSRVINKSANVRPKTKERVEAAIAKLNFTPNVFAMGLKNANTRTIGVLVPSLTNPYFTQMVKIIEKYLAEKGYMMLLGEFSNNLNADLERKYVQNFIDRKIDGIIAADGTTENRKNGFFEEIAENTPLVLINGFNKGVKANIVMADQESGTYDAIDYLIKLGHERIGFVRGSVSYSYDLKEKLFYELMEENQLEVKKEDCIVIDGLIANDLRDVLVVKDSIRDYLMDGENPTAFFACNDLMAYGIIEAAKSLNLRVPEDIAVIGFDNTPLALLSDPMITTVDINVEGLGKRAALRLVELIEGDEKIEKVILQTKLTFRDSCKV